MCTGHLLHKAVSCYGVQPKSEDAGEFRLEKIKPPTNSSAIVPFIVPNFMIFPNSQPRCHQNTQGGFCTVSIGGGMRCFTTWLHLATIAYEEAQQPVTNHVLRPLQKGNVMGLHSIFKDHGHVEVKHVYSVQGMTSC